MIIEQELTNGPDYIYIEINLKDFELVIKNKQLNRKKREEKKKFSTFEKLNDYYLAYMDKLETEGESEYYEIDTNDYDIVLDLASEMKKNNKTQYPEIFKSFLKKSQNYNGQTLRWFKRREYIFNNVNFDDFSSDKIYRKLKSEASMSADDEELYRKTRIPVVIDYLGNPEFSFNAIVVDIAAEGCPVYVIGHDTDGVFEEVTASLDEFTEKFFKDYPEIFKTFLSNMQKYNGQSFNILYKMKSDYREYKFYNAEFGDHSTGVDIYKRLKRESFFTEEDYELFRKTRIPVLIQYVKNSKSSIPFMAVSVDIAVDSCPVYVIGLKTKGSFAEAAPSLDEFIVKYLDKDAL